LFSEDTLMDKALLPVTTTRPALRRPACSEEQTQATRPIEALTSVRSGGHRRRTVGRVLFVGDALTLLVAWAAWALIAHPIASPVPVLASLGVWCLMAHVHHLYSRDGDRADHTTGDDIVALFYTLLLTSVVLFGGWQVADPAAAPQLAAVAAFGLLAFVAMVPGRAIARVVARRRPGYRERALVLGAGEIGSLVMRKLRDNPRYGIEFVGFVDPRPPVDWNRPADAPVLGDLDDLARLVGTLDIDRVFVAFALEADHRVAKVVRELDTLGVHVDIVPRLFEHIAPRANLHTIEGLPVIGLTPSRPSRLALGIKRAVDIALASVMLLAAAPVMAALAIAIKLESPGPVTYRSGRVGARGRRFELLKFRTMHARFCRGDAYGGDEAEAEFQRLMEDETLRKEFEDSHKLTNDPRITLAGRIMRKTSLDELPQLINVLTGDLTLVGPRAITTEEFEMLRQRDDRPEGGPARYWEVEGIRPGVTGYWQVHGRSKTTYEERLRLDEAYVTSQSIKLDLAILARTVHALFDSGSAR
jgi:exopolysaccharide biosynthesis polyprenyl glycosylphosphotransferase